MHIKYKVLSSSLGGKGVWRRMDTCICITEALCYPPETITALLITSTPVKKVISSDLEGRVLGGLSGVNFST